MMLCENGIPVAPPDNGLDYEQSGIRDTCRIPGPSCQALRRALAALYRLDDFHLERLGSGFFSDVYKVRHKTSGQVMVLKMNVSLVNRPNVLREVELMNRLKHPNILRFRGVCVHAGCLHALTEFMNGGSLEEWIQDAAKPLPWDLRVKLAHDTAKGLHYLHSKRVFHRDLTSKNILVNVVNQVPQAIVGDFGLADNIPDPITIQLVLVRNNNKNWFPLLHTADQPFTGAVEVKADLRPYPLWKRNMVRLPTVGSPWYMAPETLTGKWYDERADVFSFGIILCELIARIASDPDVLPRTQNFGVDYVAFSLMSGDCPPDFLQLTFKCCLVEPKSRPTFAELCALLEDLMRKLRRRDSDEVDSKPRTPRFLDDVRLGGSPKARKISVLSAVRPRKCRRSASLAYVEQPAVDLTAAQNRYVGEHMSRADPHYTPRIANPFAQSEEYRDGNKKIVGYSSSLSPTVFDIPLTSRPVTNHENLSVPIPVLKNSHSCPTSPRALRRNPKDLNRSGPTTTYESSSWHQFSPGSGEKEDDLSDGEEEGTSTDTLRSGVNTARRSRKNGVVLPVRLSFPVDSQIPPEQSEEEEDASSGTVCGSSPPGAHSEVRGASPDSECAYYSLSDQSSCESSTPKSSSRCSNESDCTAVVLQVPVLVPLIRVSSEPADPHAAAQSAEIISEVCVKLVS